MPTLPKTTGGAGWCDVGSAATLAVGEVILGAAGIALAGVLVTDDE